MTAEIEEVEEQINSNFAAIIDSAVPAIDYRVIMVSAFGDSADQRICVAAPLGGIPDDDADGHCDNIPGAPVNTANFFHHGAEISSHDALCELLDQLTTADPDGLQPTGYEAVLRPEAFGSSPSSPTTTSAAMASTTKTGRGRTDRRRRLGRRDAGRLPGAVRGRRGDAAPLVLEHRGHGPHMPSGADPYGSPHPPDAALLAPIVTDECTPSAVNPGTGYQALSILSGGYRFPTCGLDYTDIFTLMAQGVIEGAAAACEFEIPDPPPGEMLDLETVQVRYTSGEGAITTFEQVPTLADCTPRRFSIDADMIESALETCALVQGDEAPRSTCSTAAPSWSSKVYGLHLKRGEPSARSRAEIAEAFGRSLALRPLACALALLLSACGDDAQSGASTPEGGGGTCERRRGQRGREHRRRGRANRRPDRRGGAHARLAGARRCAERRRRRQARRRVLPRPARGFLASGPTGAIHATTDGGATWDSVLSADGAFFRSVLFTSDLHGFAGNLGSGLAPSIDDDTLIYETLDGGELEPRDDGAPERGQGPVQLHRRR
ncbi:MAG: hypothetical protein IPM79_37825 [Polyangiaceae bacterium]|nr:hypothetical protein [Polyangiaceae bacterium]